MSNEGLRRAVEIAGGQQALADLIGTSQSQIWYWLAKSKRGPSAESVLDIERVTGVPRHELRPDIYPAPEPEQSPRATTDEPHASASPAPAPVPAAAPVRDDIEIPGFLRRAQ